MRREMRKGGMRGKGKEGRERRMIKGEESGEGGGRVIKRSHLNELPYQTYVWSSCTKKHLSFSPPNHWTPISA